MQLVHRGQILAITTIAFVARSQSELIGHAGRSIHLAVAATRQGTAARIRSGTTRLQLHVLVLFHEHFGVLWHQLWNTENVSQW